MVRIRYLRNIENECDFVATLVLKFLD